MKSVLYSTLSITAAFILFLAGCKKDSSQPTGNTSLYAYLSSKAPQPQTFKIDASAGGQITTKANVKMEFAANTLVKQDNTPVTGMVDIKVTEYMSNADMIFSGVTTITSTGMLESGGMVNVTASQNNQPLQIKQGSDYSITMPTTNLDPDMKIFRGEEQQSGNRVLWTEASGKLSMDSISKATKMFYDKLNWVNLDKYYGMSNLTSIYVSLPKEYTLNNSMVFLILPGRSTAQMFPDLTTGKFSTYPYKIPQGTEVKILAASSDGGTLRYSMKQVTVTADMQVVFSDLAVATEKDLENFIKGL